MFLSVFVYLVTLEIHSPNVIDPQVSVGKKVIKIVKLKYFSYTKTY